MARSRSKEKESHKCNSIGPLCLEAKGIFISIAALAMISLAFNLIPLYMASLIAGVALGLYGLILIIHALKICPACHQ